MNRKAKVVTYLSMGLGLTVILAFLALWKEVDVNFHLYRLRAENNYFLRVIEKPKGTAQEQAVRLFLEESRGRKSLLCSFLRSFDENRSISSARTLPLDDLKDAVLGISQSGISYHLWWSKGLGRWPPGFGEHGAVSASPHVMLMAELMGDIAGNEEILPDYPSLVVCVVPVSDAVCTFPATDFSGVGPYVCMIRRASISTPPARSWPGE